MNTSSFQSQALVPQFGVTRVLPSLAMVALGVCALSLSAKAQVPLPMVPFTLQTLVVMLIGLTYGARLAPLTVLGYLAASTAMGNAYFAHPAGLFGPTAGYLVGFVLAATWLGSVADNGGARRFITLLPALLMAHVLIYTLGLAVLYGFVGVWDKTLALGLWPFMAGAGIKTAIALLALPALHQLVSRYKK